MDSAFLLNLPTWYYKKNWNTIIPKWSACVATMVFLCCSPSIVLFDIRNGSCEIVSQTGLFLPYVLFFLLFNIVFFAINIGFLVGLRRYRMKKKTPNRSKVEFSASKEENEVLSAGNKNISINTECTEKFKFSAEDMKNVKHSIL